MSTVLLAAVLALPANAEQPWEPIGTKGGIAVSKRHEPESPVLAFRGEGDVEVHVAKLVSVQRDRSKSLDWVDLLSEVDLRMVGETSAHVYMRYDLTWPVQDRDFMVLRTVEADPDDKVYRVRMTSIDDPHWPESDCCVRATIYRTYWQFTALENDRTHVEVEVFTDPRGSIPTWMANLVQKDWAYNSITRLAERAMEADVVPAPELKDW
jgi:hypothetical protein